MREGLMFALVIVAVLIAVGLAIVTVVAGRAY